MAYDVVVIGAGPGGYVCAIKAAELGLSTALIERRPTLGGTCVNIGCIPSKALLYASEMFAEAGHSFAALGIDVGTPKLNLAQMMAHKTQSIGQNTKGLDFLMKKNKIDVIRGAAKLMASGSIAVTEADGKIEEIEAKNIVIATGSDVAGIPGVKVDFDEKVIVSSTGALELAKVPATLVVVGGGVIGLELGSVWARLGAKVTVVEYLDTILGGMDGEVAKQFQRMLAKQGIDVPARRPRSPASTRPRRRHRHLRAGPGRRRRRRSRRMSCCRHGAARLYRRSRPGRRRRCLDERGRVKTERISHQRRRHLCDRRRDRRSDARTQGRGRGCGRGRNHRRPGRPCELRCHPERGLYQPGGSVGGQDRGRVEGGRASPTRSASFRSRPMRGRAPCSTPTGSSKFSPTKRPIGCLAAISSASLPVR